MRLSTLADRDALQPIAVIHAALDAGCTLLDTADVYCHDENDIGHNERLIAAALRTWPGDRSRVVVATKGGMRRPGGAWIPDGRARHLRAACDASRRALDQDVIELYQLHVVDPRTPFTTSVRALARLQAEGSIRRVGLSNVNVSQIEAARQIVDVHSVQVSLSVLDDTNLRNGVAEYCRDNGILLIAYRPVGGSRHRTLPGDAVLARIAERHDATAQEVALAWLQDLHADIVPIPGATRVATARSLGRVLSLRLSDEDRAELDERIPAGRLLRVPRAARRAPAQAEGEVVLVMGMPAAGKSTVAMEFVARGYHRLNRDTAGGSSADLVRQLDAGLAAGQRKFVLDNTYPTRQSRADVIESAWRHGVPVRCIWLRTPLAEAQVNAILRLLEARGRLPMPEELRALGRKDPRFFGPDAQFRYERTMEPPMAAEGFTAIEERSFVRQDDPELRGRAIILDVDDIANRPSARAVLQRYGAEGWALFGFAWRPGVSRGEVAGPVVGAELRAVRESLGVDMDLAYCPHDAGPPVCWCRKPLPGLVLEFASRRRIVLPHSLMVGGSAADRTLAQKLGVSYIDVPSFFGETT
jgi:aryl-alcohol dehydrogenase-like predicted oxidoreductase